MRGWKSWRESGDVSAMVEELVREHYPVTFLIVRPSRLIFDSSVVYRVAMSYKNNL